MKKRELEVELELALAELEMARAGRTYWRDRATGAEAKAATLSDGEKRLIEDVRKAGWFETTLPPREAPAAELPEWTPVGAGATDDSGAPDDANPKDALGIKKAPLDLVPPALGVAAAPAMQNGAEKYGPYNWRTKRVKASVYYAAALRHLQAWWDGENYATDSGAHHLGHSAACHAILLDAEAAGVLIDDRPTPGPAPEMLAALDKSKEA